MIDDAELKIRCSVLKAVQDETDSVTQQTSMPSMDSIHWIARNSVNSDSSVTLGTMRNRKLKSHLQYLQDSSCELSMLNKHKSVKSIFLHYNSTIPSSAPVERLLSTGKWRNQLNDDLFEKLLLLKLNKNFGNT